MRYVFTRGVKFNFWLPWRVRIQLLKYAAGCGLFLLGGACIPSVHPPQEPERSSIHPAISLRSAFVLSLAEKDGETFTSVLPGVYLQVRSGEDLEALIRAVIDIESGGNPRMVGQAGERGLMQIMKPTWKEISRRLYGEALSFEKAFDPDINQEVGAAYLEQLAVLIHKRSGLTGAPLIELTLAAYNAGPGTLKRVNYQLDRLSPRVRSYAERGLALYTVYRAEPLQLAKR